MLEEPPLSQICQRNCEMTGLKIEEEGNASKPTMHFGWKYDITQMTIFHMLNNHNAKKKLK